MQRTLRGRLTVAACLAAVLAIATGLGGGTQRVKADTGSEFERRVSGTGTIVDFPTPGSTRTVTVDASLTHASGLTGTLEISEDGGSPVDWPLICTFFSGNGVAIGYGVWPDSHLLAVIDNGPSGDELWFDPTGDLQSDCTAGPQHGTVLSSGDFTIASTTAPPPDANLDGIVDALQPNGTPAGSFVDESISPSTYGSIVSTNGLTVAITDATSPDGVRIVVGPGAPGTQAELSLCGFSVLLDPSTETITTCGSITLSVIRGVASIVLGGGVTVVSIPAGGQGKVTDTGGGSFSVVNLGPVGSPSVSVTVDGTTALLPGGATTTAKTWHFVGFSQPIDNPTVVNRVSAGRAIPVKWRLLDSAGVPVTDLSSASITTTSGGCGVNTTVDPIEEVVAGASGLLNLGGGSYQLNWKPPTSYEGSCRTLHLDLHDGVTHDALFQFTK